MKLWFIKQTVNDGYDTYDSAVVAAKDEDTARRMHPNPHPPGDYKIELDLMVWAKPEDVEVKCLGTAKPGTREGVICASLQNPG